MLLNEEEASEQLWQYIEARKRANGNGASDGNGHPPVETEECSKLLPFVVAVHSTLHACREAENSQSIARARLMKAIQEGVPSDTPLSFPSRSAPRPFARRQWQLALVAAMLLLAAMAGGMAAWNKAHPSQPTNCPPKYITSLQTRKMVRPMPVKPRLSQGTKCD